MAAIDQIKRCFLFFELLDDEIEFVVKSCFVESFEDGEVIFKEDDFGRDFYVVLTGKVRLTKNVDGREIEIMVINKGEALGETVLTHESKRMTNIIASGNVDLLVIDQDSIFSLYEKQPRIFAIIMLNLSRMLTKRLQKSNLTIAKMHERLVKSA
ncbi:MAG: cyclic nucleotide-binding domain-containing protein [Gammaproteobacteria bacterium]|nr:MAG: cyclic nucleotide-binding domain-containing protein [Gammaproteobacteria bacterium]